MATQRNWRARLKKGLLVQIILIFWATTSMASGLVDLHPNALQARTDNQLFLQLINQQNIDYAQQMGANIQACETAGGVDLSHVNRLLDEPRTGADGRPYSMRQVLQLRVPARALHVQQLAKDVYRLEVAVRQVREACLQVANPRTGSEIYSRMFQELMSALPSDGSFSFSRHVLMLYSLASESWRASLFERIEQPLQSRLSNQSGFLGEEWLSQFVFEIVDSDSYLRSGLAAAMRGGIDNFHRAFAEVMDVMRPHKIRIVGEQDDNRTLPFVEYIGHFVAPRPEVQQCILNLASAIDESEYQSLFDAGDVVQMQSTLFQRFSQECPDLEDADILAIMAVEDRLSTGMIPYSALMDFNASMSLFGEGILSEDEEEQEWQREFDLLKAWEQVTYLQLRYTNQLPFHHLMTPMYAICELKRTSNLRDRALHGMTYFMGFAYQIFDAATKVSRDNPMESLPQIVAEAKEDLELWQLALQENPYCP